MITRILSVSLLALGMATSGMATSAMAQSTSANGNSNDSGGESKSSGIDDSTNCTAKQAAEQTKNKNTSEPVCDK